MASAQSRKWDVLKLLLERGANPHLVNDSNENVLHEAATQGAPNHIIELLICGADIDVTLKNNDGQTAFDIAIKHNHNTTAACIEQYFRPIKSANFIA
jgi:ankyrin repeat protein